MENHDKYIEHNPLYFIYFKKKMKLMGETPIYNIKKKILRFTSQSHPIKLVMSLLNNQFDDWGVLKRGTIDIKFIRK